MCQTIFCDKYRGGGGCGACGVWSEKVWPSEEWVKKGNNLQNAIASSPSRDLFLGEFSQFFGGVCAPKKNSPKKCCFFGESDLKK